MPRSLTLRKLGRTDLKSLCSNPNSTLAKPGQSGIHELINGTCLCVCRGAMQSIFHEMIASRFSEDRSPASRQAANRKRPRRLAACFWICRIRGHRSIIRLPLVPTPAIMVSCHAPHALPRLVTFLQWRSWNGPLLQSGFLVAVKRLSKARVRLLKPRFSDKESFIF